MLKASAKAFIYRGSAIGGQRSAQMQKLSIISGLHEQVFWMEMRGASE
jgi:hypothetical protein